LESSNHETPSGLTSETRTCSIKPMQKSEAEKPHSPVLFLLFNHILTQAQEEDARTSLGVKKIVGLPDGLKEIWEAIPPEMNEIKHVLHPLKNWLAVSARQGDYVLIQGDFGACYIMVNFVFESGLIPVYSTTQREAVEKVLQDGSINLTHKVNHRIFRKYER
jgi:hypothetical protein